MYIIRKSDFLFVPLAYNDFCEDINSICKKGTFISAMSIQRIISAEVIKQIKEFIEKDSFSRNEKIVYVIDMQNVISCADHAFGCLKELSNEKIIVCNIDTENMENITEDLQGECSEIDQNTISINANLLQEYQKMEEAICNIYHDEVCNIVRWMTTKVKKEDIPHLKPLDSSGVYCNMYVNVKRLFLESEKYNFILYQMIKEVNNRKGEIDALVSSSRNGANLANLIGWVLDIKVIHCTNLGPRFSLSTYNIQKDIRKNSKYFYIFDFMCLGTELKVLNAILGVKNARLIGGFGIANYIELKDCDGQKGVLEKMGSLVDIKKEGFPYKIAGTKEEIEKNLVEEGDCFESNIQSI